MLKEGKQTVNDIGEAHDEKCRFDGKCLQQFSFVFAECRPPFVLLFGFMSTAAGRRSPIGKHVTATFTQKTASRPCNLSPSFKKSAVFFQLLLLFKRS